MLRNELLFQNPENILEAKDLSVKVLLTKILTQQPMYSLRICYFFQ